MQKKIIEVVCKTLKILNSHWDNPNFLEPDEKSHIYGGEGFLDSLALVTLISELEETIYNEFKIDIILADEKDMSQKNSPFQSVKALSVYIEKQLDENSE